MNSREIIESGTLELYVFGKLTEEENKEVLDILRLKKYSQTLINSNLYVYI